MGIQARLTSKRFLVITFILIVIKTLVGAMSFHYENDKLYPDFNFKKDFSATYSSDELEMVRSGFYYNKYGKIYTDSPFHSFEKHRVRPEGLYLTAFRPKANILLHAAGLRLAEKSNSERFNTVADIPASYLHNYGLFMFLLKTLLFPVSVWFFYKILLLLSLDTSIVRIGTMAYILIPSVFIFIGWLDYWENISLYCFLIAYYYILAELLHIQGIDKWKYVSAPLCLIIGALFRPHILLFGAAITLFVILNNAVRQHSFAKLSFASLALLIATHIPILVQNQHYFGKYVLSTQSKFEFFQGHNPFARGSWYPAVYANNKYFFDSLIASQRLENVSELEEGEFYERFGKLWIINNPVSEIELTARKLAGYFLPFNFLNHRPNIYTLLLHLSFWVFSGWFLWMAIKRRLQKGEKYFMVMLPALVSLFISILFFTGERWRFYAEPFFLIMTLILIQLYINNRRLKYSVD